MLTSPCEKTRRPKLGTTTPGGLDCKQWSTGMSKVLRTSNWTLIQRVAALYSRPFTGEGNVFPSRKGKLVPDNPFARHRAEVTAG
jgi:hypothetical protein